MKLEEILDKLNSFEKNSFLKIIDSIISKNPKNTKEVEKILSDTNKELKNVDAQWNLVCTGINLYKLFKVWKENNLEFG